MRRHLNRSLGLALVICTLSIFFTTTAGAEDACKDAKALRAERLTTDAALRRARAAASQKMLSLRSQMNDLDNKIATIEDELAKATGSRRDELWKQYDQLGEQRDKISKEMAPLQKEYTRVTTERLAKKLALKKSEMAKRYECALNEPLTTALDAVETKLPKTKQMLPVDKDQMTGLIQQRTNKLSQLKSEYQNYTQMMEMKSSEYQRLRAKMDELLKNEDATDALIDKQYDAVFESFDAFDKFLEKFDTETTEISEQLLKYSK
jgi:chromosome segregation ATPase